MTFTIKELAYLLRTVRDRINELGTGIHRYYLNRRVKSLTKAELLPELKAEMELLTSIRLKLWRLRNDAAAIKKQLDEKD